MAMTKFRVKAGKHTEAGVQYRKGEVLESDLNLDKLFVNKFERVGGGGDVEVSKGTPVADVVRRALVPDADNNPHGFDSKPPDIVPPQTRPAAEPTGEVVARSEEKEKELEAAEESEKLAEGEEEESEDEGPHDSEQFGKDVTDDFPTAKDAGITVFAKSGRYTIVDKDKPEEALNTKKLKKGDVSGAIDEYLES